MTLICSHLNSRALLPLVTAIFLATMATMDIFTKTVGKEPVKVTVKPTDTIAELKEQLELKSMKVRLRSQTLQNDKSLEHYGVKDDELLCFFANNVTPQRLHQPCSLPGR